ncbi:hypothetical protein [Neobacillus niacini]|uniref:hypothetical protein n=1 Tax=Neobacillus niacini TaxID=86668 RepID=UPI0028546E49|nr:hypothetical protein [Neobacillus niacini]MDR6999167.1 hypothetical protein [Neobacillus niacini]
MCKSEMEAAGMDCCVYCNEELAIMERNRSRVGDVRKRCQRPTRMIEGDRLKTPI